MVLRSPKTDASLSSLKTIYLSGKAPWGFRIIDLKTSMGSSNIVVSKTRNNSKADLAGLKLNDTILYINDVPTSNLSLEAAAELIDNSENLCLIVSSKSSPIAKDESPDHVSELIDEFRGEETAIVAPNNRRELSSSMTSSSSLSRRTSSSVTAPNILTNPAYSRFLLLTYSNNSSNSTANNALNNASDKSSNISVSALSNNTASTTNTNTTTTSSSDPDHYHKQQHRHENQNQNQRRTIDKNYINLISSHRRNLRNNTYYSSANESNDESDYSMSCSQYNNNTTSNNPRYNRSYNYNNSRNSNGKANSSISNYNHNSGSSSSNSNRLQSINRTGGGESLKRNEDNSEERRVSYASITLRQPVKDVNYFSDTEALTGGGGGRRTSAFRKPVSAVRFSSSSNNNNKNNSNKHCYESSSNNLSESTTNPNTFYSTSINTNQRTILSNNHNSDHNYNSFKRREPFENHTITNNNNYNNYLDYFSNIFLLNNKNNKDQMNQSSSSSSFLANNNNNFNQAMPNMFNLSTATDFNRKPHGFSKLSAFGAQPSHHNADTTSQFSSGNTSNNPIPVPFSVQPRTQPNQYVASANTPSRDHSFMQQPDHYQQQFQQPQSNNYLWAPQSQQVKMPSAALDDDIDDPVVERYEREMGSELSKPSPNKRNYADSYFYDSPLFRYPTIDEQKKLAKSIADTLEGSNPATSKYHKKKQTIMKQMAAKEAAAAGSGYDSETPQSPSGRNYYRDSPNDFSQHSNLSMDPYKLAALDNDSTVPDIIKRSIAKASMTDPVRMVQAPDNFRQQHYTEHVTHTEMPPKAAMSLAAALESDLDGKGGRGAQIFQRRKAKSEKWVVDESNVKKPPGQAYNYAPPPPPQPQPPQPQPVYVDPHINSYENDKNVNFGDYNAKPRGWSNSNMIAPPKPLRIEEPSPRDEPPPQEDYYYPHSSNSQQQKIASLSYNPNKIDLTNWTHPRNQLSDHKSPVSISKDGIEGLKARFYESARLHEDAPPQQPAVSKVKLNKLSSHQNYLFNNKNAQDALKNSTNQYYNQNYYDESNIATSDL